MATGIYRLFLAGAALSVACSVATAAERFAISEDPADKRAFAATVAVRVSGKLFPAPGAAQALPLTATGTFEFEERLLPGTGRDGSALRSLRSYGVAEGSIDAGGQLSHPQLREDRRIVVVAGTPTGLEVFSPTGPLTYGEFELLKTPADVLVARGLLPDTRVEVGESWHPPDWVLPLWAGIEAAEKSQTTCMLESVEKGQARIAVTGETMGAILGAAAHVDIKGTLLFDLEGKYIRRIELTQTEKRSVGTVAPGLDVVANATVERQAMASPRRLNEGLVQQFQAAPEESNLLLTFEAPAWDARFHHDRHWHLIHQSTETAILRLLDQGGLIAQCNIRKLPDAEAGQHVPEDQFKADIEASLGKDLQQIVQAEPLKLKEGLYVYRVTAAGAVARPNEKKEIVSTPMQWVYYLVANRDGRQVAFVFTVDPRLFEALNNRDLSIVSGLEFLPPRPKPTPAALRDR